eukprot:TRINITY_DN43405_c0_g1_i1.p1 TRINITY_DN43405_c0_g1~~TRINITY_DN43405_c0_g1_i1.p1  ORF type:complete len:301 (+),score=103.25 TRINITY_DN43405_c0_g1_i1:71-904(+)
MADAPAIVDKFADFATGEELSDAIEEWMSSHCDSFVSWGEGEEQRLEWTDCYKEYQEFVEKRLGEFCDREKTSAEQVFEDIQKWLGKDEAAAAFVPEFIQNTEYSMFARNMHEHAVSADTKAKAAGVGGGKVAGLWRAAENNDPEAVGKFLQIMGCPYVFRKIITKASRLTRNVSITIQDGVCETVYQLKFFGTTRQKFTLDGKPRPGLNMWRQTVNIDAQLKDDGSLVFHSTGYKGLPPDSEAFVTFHREGEELVTTWRGCVGKDEVCVRSVLLPE